MSHYINISIPLQTWLAQNFCGYDPHATEIKPVLLGSRFTNLSSSPYFRITIAGVTEIVLDVSPESEKFNPNREMDAGFVKILSLIAESGVQVPKLIAQDAKQGFFVFSDLGEQTCLDTILNASTDENTHTLLRPAADALIQWQLSSKPNRLAALDATQLSAELGLFSDYYLGQHLGISLTAAQQKALASVFANIVTANLGQQNVFVHGDFVPQNLLIFNQGIALKPFTGAAFGPIAYDIASLYKDVFTSFDEEPLLDSTIRYWEKAKKVGLPVPNDFGDFYRDVEWMGLQRHLYLLGLFARQNALHGTSAPAPAPATAAYIADAPRFLRYIRKVGERYTALFPLIRLFDALKIDDGIKRTVGVSF